MFSVHGIAVCCSMLNHCPLFHLTMYICTVPNDYKGNITKWYWWLLHDHDWELKGQISCQALPHLELRWIDTTDFNFLFCHFVLHNGFKCQCHCVVHLWATVWFNILYIIFLVIRTLHCWNSGVIISFLLHPVSQNQNKRRRVIYTLLVL